jgi:hypothetical protein
MPIGNGGIIGVANDPTSSVASGVWSLQEQELAKKAGAWPDIFSGTALRLDFNETTTLDSRITFTRTTNGTFFNSTGVLSTASSGAARFDHRLEGGVWVNKGLLIEEQRANLALRSEEINNAYWFKIETTVTADQITAPDGTTTADAVFETTANDFHYIRTGNITINATSSPFTVSIFIKANGRTRGQCKLGYLAGSFQEISATFNLSSGLITSTGASAGALVEGSSLTDVGDGWYRITLSGYTGQSGVHALQVFIANDVGSGSYAGDVTKGFYFWGAQLEAGAFPTSYIKTTTASVTRNADVASMTSTNFSDWYNATEGTVFWQGDTANAIAITNVALRGYEISDGTVNERISFNLGFEGNTRALVVADGGVTQCNIFSPDPAVALVANQTYKAASAYKLNDFAHSLDGNFPKTDTSGTLPTVNKINLGADLNGANLVNGHIAKFYFWNTRRPNETLQGLTS